MTDLVSTRSRIQAEEVSYQRPVSEGLLKKVGSAINYIQDYLELQNTYLLDTPGTYSWTCPAGVYRVLVELWGAGGSSAGSNDSWGGGGGGAYLSAYIDVTPTSSYSIVVASTGNSSSFGALAYAGAGSNGGSSDTLGLDVGGAGGSGSFSGSNLSGKIPLAVVSGGRGGSKDLGGSATHSPAANIFGQMSGGAAGSSGSGYSGSNGAARISYLGTASIPV